MNSLQSFFTKEWLAVFRAKLGIFNSEDGDLELIQDILSDMEKHAQDFTQTFRNLPENMPASLVQRLERQPQSLAESRTLMNASNPYLIPRNHHIERAIREGYEGKHDFFERLILAYSEPYITRPEFADLVQAPVASEIVYQTFCGT
jgi:uncharacterized protein YdiU (UPF0061 family)